MSTDPEINLIHLISANVISWIFFFRRNSNYTIQIFADDLGVNRTVISRDLELIRDFLSYFDLHLLVIKNPGVTLHGDELNKRQAIIFINNQAYEDTEKTEPPGFH